jgi:copper oxidase (laccase) domain-containing protein
VLDVDGVGTDGVATQDGRAGYAVEAWNAGKGDALVARTHDVAVGVLTADCGPLALASPEGVFAAVHAGWRGLRSGVVEAAATRMRELGATGIVGSLGPCIHAGCYAFAEPDLATVAAVYGDRVRGVTGEGGPALDLPAAVTAALEHAGVRAVGGVERCTACGGDSFSHRARRDSGRQALVVWSGAAEGR